jgi:hypothetical protein
MLPKNWGRGEVSLLSLGLGYNKEDIENVNREWKDKLIQDNCLDFTNLVMLGLVDLK